MPHRCQRTAGWLLAAVAGLVITTRGQGQVREAPRPEVRSVLKAVDAKAGSVTVTFPMGREAATEKTFTLAKDAEIVVAAGRPGVFREIKLADLSPGVLVGLTLSADGTTVESLVAEGPMVRAQVKAVDAEKRSLTIRSMAGREEPAEEKTYTVPADAEIAIDDGSGRRLSLRSGTLAELGEGTFVTLRLGIDQRQVHAIVVETPMLMGTVKAVDAAKGMVTVTTVPARGDEAGAEHTVVLAGDAAVLLDDGRGRRLSLKEGKLADVAVGSSATVRLSLDRTTATLLRVTGPTFLGLLKSVDANNHTVTFAVPKGRGEAPEEKTLAVAKDARIALDGAATTLANLKAGDNGPFVQVRLGLDQKTVQSLSAQNPRPR
jgi:hypothetical protein